jgi:hypothetical protein
MTLLSGGTTHPAAWFLAQSYVSAATDWYVVTCLHLSRSEQDGMRHPALEKVSPVTRGDAGRQKPRTI